jgi:hypothetical protein
VRHERRYHRGVNHLIVLDAILQSAILQSAPREDVLWACQLGREEINRISSTISKAFPPGIPAARVQTLETSTQ